MALYIAFADCERDELAGNQPYVKVQYPTISYYNKVGGFGSPTTFGLWTEDAAVVAAIEADPDVLIWTNGGAFTEAVMTDETNPQDVLEAYYNGEEI